jgi:hypothetical protein
VSVHACVILAVKAAEELHARSKGYLTSVRRGRGKGGGTGGEGGGGGGGGGAERE